MVKLLAIMLIFTMNVFALIPNQQHQLMTLIGESNGIAIPENLESSPLYDPIDKEEDEEISAEVAAVVTQDFIKLLYFRNDTEEYEFTNLVAENLTKIIDSTMTFHRNILISDYYDKSVTLIYDASSTIEAYDQLKSCQINKSVPIDPLSPIVANTLIQALPSFENSSTEAVLRNLIYSYYKADIIKKSKDIYEQRLMECENYDGIHYVDRHDEDESNEINDIIEDGTQGNFATDDQSGGATIQG